MQFKVVKLPGSQRAGRQRIYSYHGCPVDNEALDLVKRRGFPRAVVASIPTARNLALRDARARIEDLVKLEGADCHVA